MSYAERAFAWFFKNTVVKGFYILLDSKFLFYTLLTLIWGVFAPISLVFYEIFSVEVINIILRVEIAIIFAFLISAIFMSLIGSTKVRLILTSVSLFGCILLVIFIIPVEIQYIIPVIGSVIFAGVICIALFISIRSFNTSWVCRIMIMGKSPRKMFMHNLAVGINVLSVIAPIFLLIRYLQEFILLDLILCITGFVAWGVVMYATTHFSEHFSYDIFASILSATYLIAVIAFFLYVGTILFVLVVDFIFLVFGISAAVQILSSRRKLEKVSIMVPKTTRSPEDSTIIIIQEEGEEPAKVPMIDESEYFIEQETSEVRSNYDGLIVAILGLILCFHFIILQFIGNSFIGSGFISLLWQFSLLEYHFIFVLFGFCLCIGIYLCFKGSLRFRGYTTKTMSEQAAFVKFLSLIDEEERKRFLQKIGKTVRDILVGGVMDLIESQRRRWEEGFEKGREFLRKIFRRDEESEDI